MSEPSDGVLRMRNYIKAIVYGLGVISAAQRYTADHLGMKTAVMINAAVKN